MIDPDDQPEEDYVLAALHAGIQSMRGVTTVPACSLEALETVTATMTVVDGPYVRDLPDGARQFYVYVREP